MPAEQPDHVCPTCNNTMILLNSPTDLWPWRYCAICGTAACDGITPIVPVWTADHQYTLTH